MSSLRQQFARLRGSLKGVLRSLDDTIDPHKQIIHLECDTLRACTEAIRMIEHALGHQNVIVLVDGTDDDPRPMLCVRATEHELRAVISTLPRSVMVSYEPLQSARAELSERRLTCPL